MPFHSLFSFSSGSGWVTVSEVETMALGLLRVCLGPGHVGVTVSEVETIGLDQGLAWV